MKQEYRTFADSYKQCIYQWQLRTAAQKKSARKRGQAAAAYQKVGEKRLKVFGRRQIVVFAVGLLLGCAAESVTTEGLDGHVQKLTGTPVVLSDEAESVLGFEDPNDWSVIASLNSDHTQGVASGEVNVTGWMQMLSRPLSRVASDGASVGDAVAVDVLLSEVVTWGEVRMVIDLPSQGIWWRDLGGVRLDDLSVGVFNEVAFALPGEVAEALNGTYTDLKIAIIVNGPTMSAPLLLDNIRFNAADVDTDTENMDAVTLKFSLPQSVALKTVAVQTNESVRIADAVSITSGKAAVVNMGSGLTEIGLCDIAIRHRDNSQICQPSRYAGSGSVHRWTFYRRHRKHGTVTGTTTYHAGNGCKVV